MPSAIAEDRLHRDTRREALHLEQGQLDQRRTVPRGLPLLVRHQRREDDERAGHRDVTPQRPAQLTAAGQRVEQHQQAEGDEGDADEVQLQGVRGLGLGDVTAAEDQARDADRQVDEEDRPPLEAEQVPLGQQRAEQRTGDRARGPTIAPNRPKTLPRSCAGKVACTIDSTCGTISAAIAALEDAGGDQHLRVRGEAAQRGGERESADADEEEPLAAVDVTEPAAGDQAGGEGERVAGGDPLDLAEGRAALPAGSTGSRC